MLGQGTRNLVAGLRQLRRHRRAGLGQPPDHVGTMRRNLVHQPVARAAQRQADFLALRPQRACHPAAGLADAFGNLGRGSGEILRQGFLRRADRAAHPVGIADNRLAFAGQQIDQRADATLVVAIAALQVADFGMHQRFELAGPCQRPLDAIAHRGDFAADRLAQRHHLFGRQRLGLGQAHRDFSHGARRQAHFLGAAQQRSCDKGQHDRGECRQHDQRRFRTDLEYCLPCKGENIIPASRQPDQRSPEGDAERRIARTHIHGPEHLPGRAPVVIGRRRGGRHHFGRRGGRGKRRSRGGRCGGRGWRGGGNWGRGRLRRREGSGLAIGRQQPFIDFRQLGCARLWRGGTRRTGCHGQSGRVRCRILDIRSLARSHRRRKIERRFNG